MTDMPFSKRKAVIESKTFLKFMDSVEGMDLDTIKDYRTKINAFEAFCKADLHKSLDAVVAEAQKGRRDKYDLINDYKRYLVKQEKQTNNLKALVKKARAFLEFHEIEFSDRQFKIRVKLPRSVRKAKQPVAKDTIREIIASAPNPFLKVLLLLVAATGMRPIEAVSIRHKDLNLTSKPARVTIRAEFTKMKHERYTFLTNELTKHLNDLIAHKLRERTLAVKRNGGKYENVELKPKARPDDLLFSIYRRDETRKTPKVTSLYNVYNAKLNSYLDTIGKNEREDDGRRRKFTQYSLRRYAKSTISNAGYGDFSEWFIGHRHSEYWNVSDEEKIEVFRRVEGLLTFMDLTAIEAIRADQQSQIEAGQNQIRDLQEKVQMLLEAERERTELEKHKHQLERDSGD